MTMGLPCDRDGYDLRIEPCRQCGSRGCIAKHACKNDITSAWRARYLVNEAERLERHANKLLEQAAGYRKQAHSLNQQDAK